MHNLDRAGEPEQLFIDQFEEQQITEPEGNYKSSLKTKLMNKFGEQNKYVEKNSSRHRSTSG